MKQGFLATCCFLSIGFGMPSQCFARASHTLLFYVSHDNVLLGTSNRVIGQIRMAVRNPNINAILLVDPYDPHHEGVQPAFREIYLHGELIRKETLLWDKASQSEADMNSVDWVASKLFAPLEDPQYQAEFQANEAAVFFWGHGSGWLPPLGVPPEEDSNSLAFGFDQQGDYENKTVMGEGLSLLDL